MIGCDLDGVVTDFNMGFSLLLNNIDKKAPILADNDTPSWDWKEWYGLDTYTREEADILIEEAWRRIKETDIRFWKTLPALYPETMPRLAKIAKQAPIIFITRRDGKNVWFDTIMWLRAWGIEEPLVYVVKSGEEKGDVCKKLGIDIIIDDSPTYADEILSHGHKLIMPKWEYNKVYREKSNDPNLCIVENLEQALNMVSNYFRLVKE